MKNGNIIIVVLFGLCFTLISSGCDRKDNEPNEQNPDINLTENSQSLVSDPYLALSKVLKQYQQGSIDGSIAMFVDVDWNNRASTSLNSVVELVKSVIEQDKRDNTPLAGQSIIEEELVKDWLKVYVDFISHVRQRVHKYCSDEKYNEAERLCETMIKCGEDLSTENYIPFLIRVAGNSTQYRAVEELMEIYTKTSRQQDIKQAEQKLKDIKEQRREIDSLLD